MFTDPSLHLYRTLGLTRQSGDAGKDEDAGDYLIQTPMEMTVQTIKRATKMPLRNPGHFLQLGGEFIFESTLNVTYTHRMMTTRTHAPIRDICALAGVQLGFIHYEPGSPPAIHAASDENLDSWLSEREKHVEKIMTLKAARRKQVVMRGLENGGIRVVGPNEEPEVEQGMEAMAV
jgi:hypothetical protein